MAPQRSDLPDDTAAPSQDPQAGRGRGTWGFTALLDGFIAGPGHDMAWLEACPPMVGEVVARLAGDVGVILSVRRGYDAAIAQAAERGELTSDAHGGAWSGIEIVLTHRPEELAADPGRGGRVRAHLPSAQAVGERHGGPMNGNGPAPARGAGPWSEELVAQR